MFALLTVVFAVLTINEQFGLFNLPTVDDVFHEFGLRVTTDYPEDFSVHFIDVGQGDCILVKTSNGNMLIDSGEAEYETTVLEYLKNHKVDTLDYVVATHPHSDHIGSLGGVIDKMTVKSIIMPRLSKENTPTTRCYEKLLVSAKNSGAKIIAATPGKDYTLGDADFTVLSPAQQDKEQNNMSVVIKLEYQTKSFLFMGDAEKQIEKQLIEKQFDLKADVIKLGHHGSTTSNGSKFLDEVAPEYAVIMCGFNNKYNHPGQKTLDLLKEKNIYCYRTDEVGSIIFGVENFHFTDVITEVIK